MSNAYEVATRLRQQAEALAEQARRESGKCGGELQYGYDSDPYWQCLRCGYVDRSSPDFDSSGCDQPASEANERIQAREHDERVAGLEREVVDAAVARRLALVVLETRRDELMEQYGVRQEDGQRVLSVTLGHSEQLNEINRLDQAFVATINRCDAAVDCLIEERDKR